MARCSDLFACEAWYLPHEHRAYASASAWLDWDTKTLNGQRNDLRQSRLEKYCAKGFTAGPQLQIRNTAEKKDVEPGEPGEPGDPQDDLLWKNEVKQVIKASTRVQVWEPCELFLHAQFPNVHLQTPWTWCVGWDYPKELVLSPQTYPSHQAFLRHVDFVRTQFGIPCGSPLVRLHAYIEDGTDTHRDMKAPRLGRFRGELAVYTAYVGIVADLRVDVKRQKVLLPQKTKKSLQSEEPLRDVIFPISLDFSVAWDLDEPLFFSVGNGNGSDQIEY
jgi:hypothetical protein